MFWIFFIHNYLKDIQCHIFISVYLDWSLAYQWFLYVPPFSFWNITVLWSNTTQIVITHNLVLNWHFTLVLIKMNYGQIGDQTGLFNTTNPVFYTSGNRFVRRTGTFGNLIFSLVPSVSHNTRSTCPTSVFTGIGQTLLSRPGHFQQSFSSYIYNGLGTFFFKITVTNNKFFQFDTNKK